MSPSISIYDVKEGDEFIFGGNPLWDSPISQTDIKDKNIYIQGRGNKDSLCENCFVFWIYQAQENGTFTYMECVVDIKWDESWPRMERPWGGGGEEEDRGIIKQIKAFNQNYTTPSGDQWWAGKGIMSYTPIERGVIFVNWDNTPWGNK